MRVCLAAIVLLALAAGCGGHHGAPNVKGKPFPVALARLRAAGWLVSVPAFPRIDGSLEDYRVVAQRTSGLRTLTLKIAEAPRRVVIVLGFAGHPPPVPHLVGLSYRNAERSARNNAIVLRVVGVRPLRAAASADGIDAFVVVSQRRD